MEMIISSVVGVLLLFYVVNKYNKGVVLRNYVKEAFSTMDVYLKKRWDLIPNLLTTVKAYAEHEKNVFERVTELRSNNYDCLNDNQKIDLNTQLGFGLSKLVAVAENYPDLKANENFVKLMDDLSDVEDDIANARRYYNGTVREYNNFTQLFPSNIVALMFCFKSEKMYEITDKERESVKVSL